MNTKTFKRNPLLLFAISLLLAVIFSTNTNAQDKRAIRGEMATCYVNLSAIQKGSSSQKATMKRHEVSPNQIGYFDRVFNIQPRQKVPIEVTYPKGHAGEKAVLIVQDGGKLDNGKAVKVVQLDRQGKIAFNFQVTDAPGIYRLIVRKGQDTKVVQLWVGTESSSATN